MLQDPESVDEAMYLDHTILSSSEFSCLTTDLTFQRPIYRYCPACLESDEIPHIRLTWRVAYSFVCEHHQCALIDACRRCNCRLDLTMRFPRRALPSQSAHTGYCSYCGSLLWAEPYAELDGAVAHQFIVFQRWFHELVRFGELSERGIPLLPPTTMRKYLRIELSDEGRKPVFVGLNMEKLFGRDWNDLAVQVPCMLASGGIEQRP